MSPRLAPTALKAATPRADKPLTCGFCKDGHHQHCPRAVANGAGKIWPCDCSEPNCLGGAILRCLQCKNETPGEVSPAMWECLDPEACQVRQEKRLASNPLVKQLREITDVPTLKEKATGKATPKPAAKKAAKAPRDCACGCGDQTGGGLFRPGHDARLVKLKVEQVAGAKFTQKAKVTALKEMRAAGASEVLVAKLEKAVTLAQAKAATAPKNAGGPKPAAKKAAAKKAAPEKAAPEVEDDTDLGEDDDDF